MSNLPHFQHETSFWHQDQLVIGLDEVGRGALAGPATVAALIFPPFLKPQKLPQLNDSKRLTPKQRQTLVPLIKQHALHFSIHSIDHHSIDKLGIVPALHQAMRACLKDLPNADHLLLDGFPLPYAKGYPQKDRQTALKHGDQKSLTIAAASVLAKVHRDSLMRQLHQKHPHYHWYSNKGYGTKKHRQAIKKHGPSPLHRRTFIQNFLS